MSILGKIVERKRLQVERDRRAVSVGVLRDSEMYLAPVRSLRDAIGEHGPVAVIAEIKRSSPSGGPLRQSCDVPAIARVYRTGGAAAISVLTEAEFFGAKPGDLQDAREAVTLPVLRKDFIIDEYQIHQTKAMGADAMLLIASLFGKNQLSEFHEAATRIGLECLVEAGEPDDLEKIDFDRMPIVGVNNRDLTTMTVDLSRTREVARRLPERTLLVSESGIRTPADVRLLHGWGARAILVGTQLMRADDPGAELQALVRFAEQDPHVHGVADAEN